MQKREPVDFNGPLMGIVMAMSEGIPGAVHVLMSLIATDPVLLVTLDDMNIRGSQVWLGYKDHCGEKMERFTRCIRQRDTRMLHTINREMARCKGDQPAAVRFDGDGARRDNVTAASQLEPRNAAGP